MQGWQYNISANKISLPQSQNYTKREYYNGSSDSNLSLSKRLYND